MNEQNFIENQLVILTKQTLDIFLKENNPADLISLYTFYYYTAKWQGTNQPKCTTGYVSKGLHWARSKVIKVKKQLLEFGLIEDVRIVDETTKRVKGYYIKINYIFKKETLEKSQCTQNPTTGSENKKNEKASVLNSDRVEIKYTNALSAVNSNALSSGIKKERKKSGYDEILSEVKNEELRELYIEFIKMRKLIKSPMTDRALKMLIKKVKNMEPDSVERQKQLLENAIIGNWKSVYPLKKDVDKPNTTKQQEEEKAKSFTEQFDENFFV